MKKVKRVIVALVGGTVLAVGLSLMVLPGPAFIVIPAGLAILGVEFAWARRWLRAVREFWRGRRVPDEAKPGGLRALTAREGVKRLFTRRN